MRDNSDLIRLQAKLADIERRLSSVQRLAFGQATASHTQRDLEVMYWAAVRSYDNTTKGELELWIPLIKGLTAEQLLVLGRVVDDPYPWMPFLALLDHSAVRGLDVDHTTVDFLQVIQDFLCAQGLHILTASDVMGNALTPQIAPARL